MQSWGTFQSCTNLTKVNIDENTSILGSSIFRDCTNLTDMNIPESLVTIGEYCFYNTKIKGELNLPNVITIGKWAFANTQITKVKSLGKITEYNAYFDNCPLTELNIPETVTKIWRLSSPNVTTFTCKYENLLELDYYVFNLPLVSEDVINLCKCKSSWAEIFRINVNQVYMPLITQGDPSGYYSNYWYHKPYFAIERVNPAFTCGLLYLRDMSIMYPATFSNCKITNLVINRETPPEWRNTNDAESVSDEQNSKSRVFYASEVTNIYVPDSSVDTYKSDENWQSVADKIKPLSELASVNTREEYDQLSDSDKPNTIIKEYM